MRRGFWHGGGIGWSLGWGKECMTQITNEMVVLYLTARKVST